MHLQVYQPHLFRLFVTSDFKSQFTLLEYHKFLVDAPVETNCYQSVRNLSFLVEPSRIISVYVEYLPSFQQWYLKAFLSFITLHLLLSNTRVENNGGPIQGATVSLWVFHEVLKVNGMLVFCFNNKVYNTHKQATRLGPSYNILVESHKQKYIRNLKINLRQTLDMSPR